MWMWITRNIGDILETGKAETLTVIKRIYFDGKSYLFNDCYCCEYAYNLNDWDEINMCKDCTLELNKCEKYSKLMRNILDYVYCKRMKYLNEKELESFKREIIKQCYKIATAPEKGMENV